MILLYQYAPYMTVMVYRVYSLPDQCAIFSTWWLSYVWNGGGLELNEFDDILFVDLNFIYSDCCPNPITLQYIVPNIIHL